MNFKLEETILALVEEVVIIGQKPLLDIEQTSSSRTVTAEDIKVAGDRKREGCRWLNRPVCEVRRRYFTSAAAARTKTHYLLDGISVQDPLAGTGFGLQLSAASIRNWK
jgi:hypothetical protein